MFKPYNTNEKQGLRQIEMASGIKIYDYLCAGLPVICTCEHRLVSKIITDHKLGFCIPYQKIDKIISLLDKQPYNILLHNIRKHRQRFLNNPDNINQLIGFLDTPVNHNPLQIMEGFK